MNRVAQQLRTRRGRVAAMGAALLTAGVVSGAMAGVGQASAADVQTGPQQWVQIVAKGNGGWTADMTLYDQKGNQLAHWHRNPSMMETKDTWRYTGGDGYVEGTINEADGEGGVIAHPFKYGATDAPGHCWKITDTVRYTGDSITGGCTPD